MILDTNLDETLPIVCNTGDDLLRSHVQAACLRDLPWLNLAEPHDRAAVLVGGGPSMKPLRPMIAAMQRGGAEVFAVNGVLPTLHEADIVVDHHVLLDARPENTAFVQGPKARHYLVASQCHPSLFDAILGLPATLWHSHHPKINDWIGQRNAVLIGGGTTVGLQALSIAFALGHRTLHVFGFDSCYSEAGLGHAYPQALNEQEPIEEYRVGDGRFMCSVWMARQAMEFQTAGRQLCDGGAALYVHGSGLIPTIAARMGYKAN